MRKINSVIFVIGLLAFLLPFVQVSCGGNTLMVVSGKQLITGFSVSLPAKPGESPNAQTPERRFKGDKYARGILALLVLSLLVALFANYPIASYILVVFSALGAGALLILRSRILEKAAAKGAGLLEVRFREGFWTLLAAFIAAFLLNLFYRKK